MQAVSIKRTEFLSLSSSSNNWENRLHGRFGSLPEIKDRPELSATHDVTVYMYASLATLYGAAVK